MPLWINCTFTSCCFVPHLYSNPFNVTHLMHIIEVQVIVLVLPPPVCSAGRSGGSSGAAWGQSGTASPAEARGGRIPEAAWSLNDGPP